MFTLKTEKRVVDQQKEILGHVTVWVSQDYINTERKWDISRRGALRVIKKPVGSHQGFQF